MSKIRDGQGRIRTPSEIKTERNLDASEEDLRAELKNARILHLRRLPLRAKRVVDLHYPAPVEHVVDVEVSLHAKPLAEPHQLGETHVQPADSVIVEGGGGNERNGYGRRTGNARPARGQVASKRGSNLLVTT